MKKIIAFVAACALATPALADGRHGHNRGHVRHNHHGHWVGPLVGGIVLGAIIADANAKQKEKEVIVVKQNCFPVTVEVRDQWGNVLERHTETRCTTSGY